jgi:hypothetical protein
VEVLDAEEVDEEAENVQMLEMVAVIIAASSLTTNVWDGARGRRSTHPGVLAAKVSDFGSNLLKCG